MRFWMLLFAAFWLLEGSSHARAIRRPPPPEQMDAESTLICTGKVIFTGYTGSNLTSVYVGGVPGGYPETVMFAKVKILHVSKGTAPAEIEFRYREPQPGPLMDSPLHVRLETGTRYRFFLKPGATPGEFVSVLEGTIDDCFAVQLLYPVERDDSPYLHTDEAVKIACDYLRKEMAYKREKSRVSVTANPYGGLVFVHFDVGDVAVRGNRTIDTQRSHLKVEQ